MHLSKLKWKHRSGVVVLGTFTAVSSLLVGSAYSLYRCYDLNRSAIFKLSNYNTRLNCETAFDTAPRNRTSDPISCSVADDYVDHKPTPSLSLKAGTQILQLVCGNVSRK
jgi:hypothetical protein